MEVLFSGVVICWGYNMTKFLSYLAVFLLLTVYILSTLYIQRGHEISTLKTEKNALKGNITFLEKNIEERNQKALEASERVRELEEEAEKAKNKGGFDWNTNLPNDGVVIKLRGILNE